MSQPITEIPMAVTMPQNHGYPTTETMTTNVEQIPDQETTEQTSSSLLRLRGGAGCITDCLAAIGCCVVCEDCCC